MELLADDGIEWETLTRLLLSGNNVSVLKFDVYFNCHFAVAHIDLKLKCVALSFLCVSPSLYSIFVGVFIPITVYILEAQRFVMTRDHKVRKK